MTEYEVIKRPNREPTHPGAILRSTVLPALEMSVSEAARQIGTTRANLHRIMTGKTGVSPEMALRLGRFCGNGPGLWLRMQQKHDLWHLERELKAELKKIPTHAGAGIQQV